MRRLVLILGLVVSLAAGAWAGEKPRSEYTVGIDDTLEISILQPEELMSVVTVAPDGNISFPYLGNVYVKGLTLDAVQGEIQTKLAQGYMKYPLVAVSLRQSRSRKFFVYGEVIKPGAYPMEEDTTVLRAISRAGGFTKFASSSRVKILRRKTDGPGYEMIKVNIKAIMQGKAGEDILLKADDIVVVSEGMF